MSKLGLLRKVNKSQWPIRALWYGIILVNVVICVALVWGLVAALKFFWIHS